MDKMGLSLEDRWAEERNNFSLKIPCLEQVTIICKDLVCLKGRSTTNLRLGVDLFRRGRSGTWSLERERTRCQVERNKKHY